MALDRIQLSKALKLMFLPAVKRRAEIRKQVRNEFRRANGEISGGDFYVPFWADAKNHAFGTSDLNFTVEARIAVNGGRENLYPRLRDGFLLWWNEKRRWTNEPFSHGPVLKARIPFNALSATVKVDNILSVRDGLGIEHVVYPYFAPDLKLSEEAARLGLSMLTEAFPQVPSMDIRILDVIRGEAFSPDRTTLHGNEREEFERRFSLILNEQRSFISEMG